MTKSIEIIKNRSDIGAGTRGSDLGIDAIEIAAINKGSDFFVRFPHKDLKTRNHAVYNSLEHPFARYIPQIYEQCIELGKEVEQTLLKNKFPLVFSGDHSSAIGTISGIKQTFPDKRLGVIWIDAHADIHSPYTTPSGNMHGMPLAALMHLDHLVYKKNEIKDETYSFWNQLKNIGGNFAKIEPKHLVYFGVRDVEQEEIKVLTDLNIKNFTVDEVRQIGATNAAKEALTKLKDCDLIYISFDVDSMDSILVSDGTGTPVPRGFNEQEVTEIMNSLFKSDKIACLEIVEVNPLLDSKGNKMAEVTFDILENVVDHFFESNKINS